MKKRCPRCGKTKQTSKFHKDTSRKDGHACWCKECVSKSQAEYYAKNRERLLEKQRRDRLENIEESLAAEAAYRDRNRERINTCHRSYYASHREEESARKHKYYIENREEMLARSHRSKLRCQYGLTLDDYDEMLEVQNGGCAICGMTPEDHGKRLYVDHDHETGETRGLLCHNCNVAIGFLHNSQELAWQLILYLQRYEG